MQHLLSNVALINKKGDSKTEKYHEKSAQGSELSIFLRRHYPDQVIGYDLSP